MSDAPGEGGGNLAGVRGWEGLEPQEVEEQVCPHSWQGSGFQSTFCFCQPIACSAKATGHWAFQSPKSFHLQFSFFTSQRWYPWLYFTDGETEAPRERITCPNPEGLMERN